MNTQYFYAGYPASVVAVEPVFGSGVRLSITDMQGNDQLACVMSAASFRELFSEGCMALAEVDRHV